MAVLYQDDECVYLGDDPRIDDELFGKTADVQITSDDLVVRIPHTQARFSYPRSKIRSCRQAQIEWQEEPGKDLKIKKSRLAVVCEFKSGPPERNDEPEIPDDLVLSLGFRNKQFAQLFETRLKENTPLSGRH